MRATSEVVGSYGTQPVALSASAINITLTKGARSTATLLTAPNAHAAWVLNIAGARAPILGTAKADAAGKLSISFVIPAASAAGQPVQGTLAVHITDPGSQGTATITFHALPLLQYAASTRVKPGPSGTALTVTVTLGQPATVTTTVTLMGARKPALIGTAVKGDAKHPVVVFGTFGPFKGVTQAVVAVKVVDAGGKADTLSFPVALQ